MTMTGRLVIKWWSSETGRQAAMVLMRRTWPEAGEAELAARLDTLPLPLPLDLDAAKAEGLLRQLAESGLTAEYWPQDEELPVRLASRPRLEVAEAISAAAGETPPEAETHPPRTLARLLVLGLIACLVVATVVLALPYLAGWLAKTP